MSDVLKWKEQFGYYPWTGNLDALNDGLRGQPFDSADNATIAIENFDALIKSEKHLSLVLLDLLERHSRNYLLFGKRLIGLIQTNNPKIHFESIGGTSAQWNRDESLDSSRGL